VNKWALDPNFQKEILMMPTLHRKWHRDITTPQIITELSLRKPIRYIADVGCGEAWLRGLLDSRVIYSGFDLFPELGKGINKWDIANEKCPIETKFDCIVLHDVIEHLPNPFAALSNLSHSLASAGYLVLTSPNIYWSKSRFHMLFQGNLLDFKITDLILNHHCFPAIPFVVQYYLLQHNFKILEYSSLDDFPPLNIRESGIRFPLHTLFKAAYRIVEIFDKRAVGRSYCLVAQKAS